MVANQLTDMLTLLRELLQEHPAGIHLDAEMVAAFIDALRDMERAAHFLEQADIERRELLTVARDLDVVAYAKAGEIGGVMCARPSGLAALASAIGASNVVSFPRAPHRHPILAPDGGDAA